MHQLPENMFLLSLRQYPFSNFTPPFLYLKKWETFTQIQQKQPSQRPVVARVRDTYAPTSRKYVSTESNTRSFQ